MVEQEVFGTVLRFVQDPSSEHLGTTVWDASVVLAKWFEKNIRKGDFSRAKVRGKRAVELGAGMGLAGMAFAMVGADVVLTDTADVLDLLRINYETNLSPAAVRLARGHQHGTWADSAGSVAVAELDWTKPEQVHAPPLKPPYDFVLAADCIYHETLTEHFHRTVMDVTNEKSTVVVCNELRSHSVQGRFMDLFTATHTIKSVPHTKMDDTYQHPNIFIYIMKKKKKPAGAKGGGGEEQEDEAEGAAAAATAAAAAASGVAEGCDSAAAQTSGQRQGQLEEQAPEQAQSSSGSMAAPMGNGNGAGASGPAVVSELSSSEPLKAVEGAPGQRLRVEEEAEAAAAAAAAAATSGGGGDGGGGGGLADGVKLGGGEGAANVSAPAAVAAPH